MSKLLSIADVAATVGISRNTVWTHRRRYADYPAPTNYFGQSPVWEARVILAWYEAHDPRPGRRVDTERA